MRSVSFTTRPKRSKEKHAENYFFISPREFEEKRKTKKILEWTKYLGYYYATPKDFLGARLKEGKSVVLCLDFKGAREVKKFFPKDTVTIFILPPSIEELRRRIERRCAKTEKQEVKRRLVLAKKELLNLREYDYSIMNKNLIDAKKRLKEIILKEIISRHDLY